MQTITLKVSDDFAPKLSAFLQSLPKSKVKVEKNDGRGGLKNKEELIEEFFHLASFNRSKNIKIDKSINISALADEVNA